MVGFQIPTVCHSFLGSRIVVKRAPKHFVRKEVRHFSKFHSTFDRIRRDFGAENFVARFRGTTSQQNFPHSTQPRHFRQIKLSKA